MLLSLWFLIVSSLQLAPISCPKRLGVLTSSRNDHPADQVTQVTVKIYFGQETSRFKWASKYLIVFFGWFLFSCQTDSKPKCCGGVPTHKKTSQVPEEACSAGLASLASCVKVFPKKLEFTGQKLGKWGHFEGFPLLNHHLELTSAEVAINLPRTFGSSIYGVRLWTFEPHRFLPYLKTPNTTWSQELLHN